MLKDRKYKTSHPKEQIIDDAGESIKTISLFKELMNSPALISKVEPKEIEKAITKENWIKAMQEEFHQFKVNGVSKLIPRLVGYLVIGTKWVFRNKLDDKGHVIRDKTRLVAKGYSQEDIDYDETYATVTRLKATRLLLAYACYHDFKLY